MYGVVIPMGVVWEGARRGDCREESAVGCLLIVV